MQSDMIALYCDVFKCNCKISSYKILPKFRASYGTHRNHIRVSCEGSSQHDFYIIWYKK